MNELTKVSLDQVLIDTRKAYRLLYAYQRWIIDAVTYLGSQFDLEENAAWTKFSEGDIRSGYAKLRQPARDWLPFLMAEFHFLKRLEKDGYLSLSCIIISDTGYFDGPIEDTTKDDLSTFAPVEKSKSCVAFILREGHWDKLQFLEDKAATKKFLSESKLPDDLVEKGFVAKAYDLDCFINQASINSIRNDLLILAKDKGLQLALKKLDPDTTK